MEIHLNSSSKIENQEYHMPSEDVLNHSKEEMIKILQQSYAYVDVEKIQLKNFEFMNWPDTSMGCPEEGKLYAQMIVPGYKIQYVYQDKVYTIHSDLEGNKVVSPHVVHNSQEWMKEKNNKPSIFDLAAKNQKK